VKFRRFEKICGKAAMSPQLYRGKAVMSPQLYRGKAVTYPVLPKVLLFAQSDVILIGVIRRSR
jgi:hypothetical protein